MAPRGRTFFAASVLAEERASLEEELTEILKVRRILGITQDWLIILAEHLAL
jgi:hypothetical protein